eukprot:NODE_9707_length_1404_cov_3.168363.p1 GENE.NODE_9707_length_1404_cov_3.168363~~NODE_9707_length_1404_cov_3.168363.p1  ORF type:complete len:393 (+),score=56.78 NODE_9707_length_1404_cov_3.168363:187-1365(+)
MTKRDSARRQILAGASTRVKRRVALYEEMPQALSKAACVTLNGGSLVVVLMLTLSLLKIGLIYFFSTMANKRHFWSENAATTMKQIVENCSHEVTTTRCDAIETLSDRMCQLTWQPELLDDAAFLILASTKDGHAGVRRSAGIALGKLVPHLANDLMKQAFDALLQLTKDKNEGVQKSACEGLLENRYKFCLVPGDYLKQFGLSLVVMARNESSDVRCCAGQGLFRIGPDLDPDLLKQVGEALVVMTRDESSDVRCKAGTALGEVGPRLDPDLMKQAGDALVAMTRDNRAEVQRRACLGLGQVGPYLDPDLMKQAGDAFVVMARDKDAGMRMISAKLLGALAAANPIFKEEAIRALTALSNDHDEAFDSQFDRTSISTTAAKVLETLRGAPA